MKRTILAAAVAATLALSACTTTGQQAFLKDIQTCTRDYQGTVNAGIVGGGAFTGSIKVHCDPSGSSQSSAPAPAATSSSK